MLKKILKIAVSFALICSMGLSAFADTSDQVKDFESSDEGLFISTLLAPHDATEYAINTLSKFTIDDLLYLGFTTDEANQIKLAPAFTPTLSDPDGQDVYFYFPVMCSDEVVGLMTVGHINGSYTFQLSKDPVAEALNSIETSENAPAEIVVSYDAYFAVDPVNGVEVLWQNPDGTVANVEAQKTNIARSARKQTALLDDKAVVSISDDTAFEIELAPSQNNSRAAAPDYWGKQRPVPIVRNYTTPGGKGTCWASCTGALIEYYLNGDASTADGASEYRWDVLDEHGEENGGNIDDAAYYIDLFAGYSTTKQSSQLSWTAVKNQVNTRNAPCYMRLTRSGSTTGHAVVLSGYRYDNNDPNNTAEYWIYTMDPNKSTRAASKYTSSNCSYSSGSYTYTWEKTLLKG